ncbi:MAG TPA: DNA adenine methylase [Pyrinomonadaceae bacterium]|nr:DNA adenine methylase [Pyrinomonadaceae bacterium]
MPEPVAGKDDPSSAREALARRNVSIISPLRYPGGKRRLAGYIAEAIRLNGLRPRLFVEPFAGGASVALQLLNDGLVERIALGEKDPLLASFWKTVFNDHEWLVEKLRETEPTLANWDRFKHATHTDDRTRALACLFLNRTSFSGIIAPGGGPLGGRAQKSAYALGCRYPVESLARRIKQAAQLSERVLFVNEGDWQHTVRRVRARKFRPLEVLYYFDPPFYHKAEKLYRFYFDTAEHQRLHDALSELGQPWLLSYDAAQPIIDMYMDNGIGPKRVELLYSAANSDKPVEMQELIVTNLRQFPSASRLWRTSDEWKTAGK